MGAVAVLGLLALAFTVLASPIALFVGALVGAVVGVATFGKKLIERITGVEITWGEIWERISRTASGVIDWVGDKIAWVSEKIERLKKRLQSVTGSRRNRRGREHGGIIQAPRGMPVPIIAHGQERIIPASRAMSGGGGAGVSIGTLSITVRTDDDASSIRQGIERALRDVIREQKIA